MLTASVAANDFFLIMFGRPLRADAIRTNIPAASGRTSTFHATRLVGAAAAAGRLTYSGGRQVAFVHGAGGDGDSATGPARLLPSAPPSPPGDTAR